MLHRHARPAVAGAFTAGTILGALATASVLLILSGLLSPIPGAYRGIAAIGLVIVLLGRQLGLARFELPERRHQIPREVFFGSPAVSAFRFAAELGTSLRTYVPTSAPHAFAVVLVLCAPDSLGAGLIAAAAAALGFGLGRAGIVASQAWRRTIAVDHPAAWLATAAVVSIATSLGVALRFLAAV